MAAWVAPALAVAAALLASMLARLVVVRRRRVAVGSSARAALLKSHCGSALPESATDAAGALRLLLAGGPSVRVLQAMVSHYDGAAKHVVRLAANARQLKPALLRLCGEAVGEIDGALCGRHAGVWWILHELACDQCVVVRIASDGPAWTPIVRSAAFEADRAPLDAAGRLPTRWSAKMSVDFERAVAFFVNGEALHDPNVERFVVTARSEGSITTFTQFFGQWPVVGPRHEHMRFSIEVVSPTEVLMRGCTVPDDDATPSPSSLPMEKTRTQRIWTRSDGVVLFEVTENTDAKLPIADPPKWACAFVAKKLRARMEAVEAHLSKPPAGTTPVTASGYAPSDSRQPRQRRA